MQAALPLIAAGLAGLIGGVVGVQMIHGHEGRAGVAGRLDVWRARAIWPPRHGGTRGPYGQHMAMLLNDGQFSIIDASGVESKCAVLQPASACQGAVSFAEEDLTAMRNQLEADTTAGVPVAERALETNLVTELGTLTSNLGTCGQAAVFGLSGTSISSVIDVSIYWSALVGCASPSAPYFEAQVKALQMWSSEAQTYAGP